ncbi:MAG: hypothetical protein WC332_06800 [Clostridia bacterium]
MKKIITFSIFILVLILLFGCSTAKISSYTESLKIEDLITEYARTNGYHNDMLYPYIKVIKNEETLLEYYKNQKNRYSMESDDENSFKTIILDYNESYFENNVLVIILIEEPSGSIRHEIESVNVNDNSIIFGIKSIVPEMGTTDMAQWHILISIPSDLFHDEDIEVNFN